MARKCTRVARRAHPLDLFHPAVQEWFSSVLPVADAPPAARMAGHRPRRLHAHPGADRQRQDARRVPLVPEPPDVRAAAPATSACRVLYISPLKALAVDVERNLRAPLAGIANVARAHGRRRSRADDRHSHRRHAGARARGFLRHPADILITTPESLFLLLTSNARERLRSVDTVIIDEIHALVPSKRGAHLALSLERLEALADRDADRCNGSAFPPPSGRSRRWHVSWAARRPRRADRRRDRSSRNAAVPLEDRIRAPRGVRRRSRPPTFRPVTVVNAAREEGARAADRGAGRRHGATAAGRVPSGPAAQGGHGCRSGRPLTRGCWS